VARNVLGHDPRADVDRAASWGDDPRPVVDSTCADADLGAGSLGRGGHVCPYSYHRVWGECICDRQPPAARQLDPEHLRTLQSCPHSPHRSRRRQVALSSTNYPVWNGSISLPPGIAFQYKYVKQEADGSFSWESDPNRSATTSETADTQVLHDTWQGAPTSTSVAPAPTATATVNVTFAATVATVQGEHVVVTGSLAQLGTWSPTAGVRPATPPEAARFLTRIVDYALGGLVLGVGRDCRAPGRHGVPVQVHQARGRWNSTSAIIDTEPSC
jgi:hypothetical protein